MAYGKLPAVVTKDMLSDEDIQRLRAELAEGRTPTVWFTPAAVGMPAGKSAKVLAFDEPAEGEFIKIRPTGSQDEVSLSPSELTANKPPRKTQPTRRKAPVERPKPAPAEPFEPWTPEPASTPKTRQTSAKPAAEKPKPAPAGRRKPPSEVSVTLNSTPEGEWTVEVMVGKRRAVRSTPVAATAVAKAAKELPDEVHDAIEAVLDAARQLQQDRIERLRAELEAAQRTLDDLSD